MTPDEEAIEKNLVKSITEAIEAKKIIDAHMVAENEDLHLLDGYYNEIMHALNHLVDSDCIVSLREFGLMQVEIGLILADRQKKQEALRKMQQFKKEKNDQLLKLNEQLEKLRLHSKRGVLLNFKGKA